MARAATVDAVVSAAASVIILFGGCLYPIYFMKYDADLQRAPDPDFRAGAVIPIAVFLSLVFAGRALWSYFRARRLRAPAGGLL